MSPGAIPVVVVFLISKTPPVDSPTTTSGVDPNVGVPGTIVPPTSRVPEVIREPVIEALPL